MTATSILGAAIGFSLGTAAHATGSPLLQWLGDFLTPIGELWVNALRVLIVPMVVTLLLATIVSNNGKTAGRLGALAMVLIVATLVSAWLFGLVLAPLLVGPYDGDPSIFAPLSGADALAGQDLPDVGAARTLSQWISSLIPRDPVTSAVNGNILPLLLLTAAFAFAVNRTPPAQREPLAKLFQGASSAIMILVRWVLVVTPFAVFALTYSISRDIGFEAVNVVVEFAVIESSALLALTLLLYPVAVLVGRVPLGRFARGVAPAQMVAISTRSSIASLPALITGAREHLRLPPAVTSLVLPLCVSVFKASNMMTSACALFFLAEIFEIPLTFDRVASYALTVILISFTSPGIPGGGPLAKRIAIYATVGIPPEGALLVEMAEVISDVFRTLVNVTADMTVAVLAARFAPAEAEASLPPQEAEAPVVP